MRGIARNEPTARAYLESCPAVESVTETDASMLSFKYDAAKQPTEGIPDGVFFDLSEPAF